MGKIIAEFSLADLVGDPLVGLMMKSDGVDRRSVELLFERVARDRAQDVNSVQPGLPARRLSGAPPADARWRRCASRVNCRSVASTKALE